MRKNASKKVITFMLAAAMAVTAVPAGVFADEVNTASQHSAADTETNDVSVQSGAFEAAEGDEQTGAEAESEQTVAESESTDGQTPKSEEPEGGADTSENEIQTYAEDVDYGVESVNVSGVDQTTGAFTVTISGVNAPSGVKNITVPVWSKEDQSDIYWYTASRKEDGTYVVNGNVSNHKYNKGAYNVHTYVENSRGELEFVNKTTMDVTVQVPGITMSDISDSQKKASIAPGTNTIFGKNYQIQFAVWSETGGQDDIIWYNAKGASGTYSSDISIASHKGTGVYNVHAYAKLDNGTMIFLSKTTFEVAKASASSVSVSEINKNTGAFKVTVSGLSSPFGVKEVTIPVWSKADQSDIYWYTAVKQSDGTYVANCNLSRHSYNMGTYNIHAYVENSMGTLEFLGKTTAEANGGKLSVSKSSDLYYTASISDLMGADDIKSLQFAVWSITGGQDDIIWYDASLKDGVYSADIDITNHMTTGKYAVHAYAKLKDGSSKFITGIEFNVSSIPGSSVKVTGTGNGTFDITVTPVIKSSKYKEISIPVWSEAGGQDDIIWYKGVKQADGTYKASVNVKDHGYGAGAYNVHSYAVLTDGSMTFLAKTTYTPSVQNIISTTKLSDSCVRVTVHGASCNGTAASSVRFAVWSEAGGQDDIQWLEGTKGSDGSFYTDVYRSDFGNDGIYITHVYTYAGGGSQLCSTAVTFSLYYPTDYDSYAASVMRNIIYAVETGGQIYGNARYDDFTAAYTNSKSERAITIGAGCWYATEAKRLLSLIRTANPTEFAQLDSAGIGNDLDTADWSTYGSDGTVLSDSQSIADGYSHRTITAGSEKAVAIQKIISTDTGKEIQNQLVDEQMSQYVQEAAELGVADLKARMFCANLRHLGGYGGMSRVIENCINDGLELTMDNLWATMLKYDTGNQVGGPIYRTRHQKVMQWLNKYIG